MKNSLQMLLFVVLLTYTLHLVPRCMGLGGREFMEVEDAPMDCELALQQAEKATETGNVAKALEIYDKHIVNNSPCKSKLLDWAEKNLDHKEA